MCIISTFLLLYKILLDKSPVPQSCLSFLIKTLCFFFLHYFLRLFTCLCLRCVTEALSLRCLGFLVGVHGLSGCNAWAQLLCEILILHLGINPSTLYCKVDSQTLGHQGSPCFISLNIVNQSLYALGSVNPYCWRILGLGETNGT